MLTPEQISQLKASAPSSNPSPTTVHPDVNAAKASFGASTQPATPGVLSRVSSSIKSSINDAGNEISGTGPNAGENPIQRGVELAATATGAPVKAVGESLPKPVRDIVGGVGNAVGGVVNWLGDKIGSTKAAQDFVTNHPEAAKALEGIVKTTGALSETAGNVGAIMGGVDTAKSIGSKLQEGADAAKFSQSMAQAKPTVENVPVTSEDFGNQVNKVFPVQKSDVGNLPKKYENVQNAFKDIADNKDSLGLTDKSGNPRLPTNYAETAQAQSTRMDQIYKDYTAKLSTADATKFQDNIHQTIFDQMDKIKENLGKENSTAARGAMTKISKELGSLRDTSPQGIQNYIERIGQQTKTAPGHPWTPLQVQYINLSGELRGALDSAISKTEGEGYQDLRNTYAAHKGIESQLLSKAKTEINATPGLSDKLTNIGLTGEGLNFLITHDPHSLVVGAGIKGVNEFVKWLNSPQRALQNVFKSVAKGVAK